MAQLNFFFTSTTNDIVIIKVSVEIRWQTDMPLRDTSRPAHIEPNHTRRRDRDTRPKSSSLVQQYFGYRGSRRRDIDSFIFRCGDGNGSSCYDSNNSGQRQPGRYEPGENDARAHQQSARHDANQVSRGRLQGAERQRLACRCVRFRSALSLRLLYHHASRSLCHICLI